MRTKEGVSGPREKCFFRHWRPPDYSRHLDGVCGEVAAGVEADDAEVAAAVVRAVDESKR